jgi:hypothetical protein
MGMITLSFTEESMCLAVLEKEERFKKIFGGRNILGPLHD